MRTLTEEQYQQHCKALAPFAKLLPEASKRAEATVDCVVSLHDIRQAHESLSTLLALPEVDAQPVGWAYRDKWEPDSPWVLEDPTIPQAPEVRFERRRVYLAPQPAQPVVAPPEHDGMIVRRRSLDTGWRLTALYRTHSDARAAESLLKTGRIQQPAQPGEAAAPRPDPKKCTATVTCDGGYITTRSCTTGRPLIDKGGSSDGERDYYECPDCGKSITIDYREN